METDVNLKSMRWRLARYVLARVMRRAAHRVLSIQTLEDRHGNPERWLRAEIDQYFVEVEAELSLLRPLAELEKLPTFGNQMMVEMALYTAAADRVLRAAGVPDALAHQIIADLGWDVYSRMILLVSAPFRLLTRNPGRRLRWSVRTLLWFPFSASQAPGYAVTTTRDGEDFLTHFTHCPPQTCARQIAKKTNDPEVLETFRQSWCTYDWPGADLIAGDAARGHYRRTKTLSHGDAVCDMCWKARAAAQSKVG